MYKDSSARPHLHLPAPWAMKRWYQQLGLHLDCGPSPFGSTGTALERQQRNWREVDRRCYALHFPRTFPCPDECAGLVAPFKLSTFLSHGAWESYASATVALQYLWYEEQPFFESALGGLRRYCEQADGPFDAGKAICALKDSASGEPP
jgi:hypothetical protein